MAKKQEKEIERWVTVNGARVPIFKDGSVGGPKALRDKVKAVVKEKSSDGKPLKDMSATDIGKEYLTATGERKKQLLKELHNRGYRRNKDGSWTNGTAEKKYGEPEKKSKEKSNADSYNAKVEEYKKTGKVEGYTVSKNEDGQLLFIPKSTTEKELQRAKEYKENLIKEHNNTKSRFKAKPSDIRKADEKIKELEQTLKDGKDKYVTDKQTKVQKTISDSITSAKTHKELTDKLNENGLKLDSADAYDIRNSNSLNGEKVTMYDEDGNEYRGTYNKYSDGGREIVDIKKTKDSPKKIARDNEDLKEKQIKQNKAEKETVEQAMDRLQKESRAKVDSMSAQQVMKYAKENGLRGLKTDTPAQRDDRVANHMYMQEMKKWRAEKDKLNGEVSDRVKSYQDKFLKKRSIEEIKEIQSNIEKGSKGIPMSSYDMVAMRAIENELKERKASKGVKGTNSKEDRVKKTFGTTAAEARKSLKEYDNIDLKEVALECGFDRKLVDYLTSQELRAAILAIYKRK